MKFVSVYCTQMVHIFDIKSLIALAKDNIIYIENLWVRLFNSSSRYIISFYSLLVYQFLFSNEVEIFSIKIFLICIIVNAQNVEKQIEVGFIFKNKNIKSSTKLF